MEDISLIIKSLNPRKATGPDCIPLKVIKFASNVIDPHLCNIKIKDLEKSKYSKEPKTALVRSVFKKNEKNKIGNYRPVGILNGMSKIYERFIHNSLSSYAETISNFVSAYRKSYSSNHVLLRLIENWKKSLDNKILQVLFLRIFINDLFLFIKGLELANFASDNTVYAARNSIKELIKVLEKESKSAIDWFKMNDMIVNPDKF